MRITYKQLQKIINKENDTNKLKLLLQLIFKDIENFDTFCYYFFSEAITAKFADFHQELINWLFTHEDGAMAAPRGHAKSTLVGLFFIAYLTVNKLEKYIVYISQNYSKTVQFIEPLKMSFSNNERLKYVYGDLTPKKTIDEEGKYREDIIDVNGIRIQAASFEGNIRGFKYKYSRPTLIILDDIEGDDRVINPDLRKKDEYKLNKIIIPSLDPDNGRIKMIGTILHWDSLLIKKIRLYKGKIYRAIDQQNKILWPKYWSHDKLMKKKYSIGSVSFSSEFLNNPIENEAGLIKKEWINKCLNPNISYNDKQKYDRKILGCDFAFGDRITNDQTAFVGVGTKNDEFYITEIFIGKGMTITEQFEHIQELYKKDYTEVVLEENSIKSMSKDLYQYNFNYYLIWTGSTDTPAKLRMQNEFENKRHTVGKKAMILRLATIFENNKIHLPYKTEQDKNLTDKLINELLTFALNDGKLVEIGIHADIPIGLSMAMERLNDNGFVMNF